MKERMLSGVCSINYGTIRYISLVVIFFLIGVSLAESFNFVSNVWHVEMM